MTRKINIEGGTDLTQFTEEEVGKWLKDNKKANLGKIDEYDIWQNTAAYRMNLQSGYNVIRAIADDPESFEIEKD